MRVTKKFQKMKFLRVEKEFLTLGERKPRIQRRGSETTSVSKPSKTTKSVSKLSIMSCEEYPATVIPSCSEDSRVSSTAWSLL
jgi:hypothetical protein